MDCSTSDFPVHHQLPEYAQIMSVKSEMPFNHLILCHMNSVHYHMHNIYKAVITILLPKYILFPFKIYS